MTDARFVSPRRLAALCTLVTLAACGDGGGREDGVADCEGLLPGDLVISEIMANPPGSDAGQEWFEIYNASGAELDLGGVVLRFRKTDGSGEKLHQIEGLTIAPEQYLVVGDADPAAPPAHVDYGYGDDFGQGFNNAAGEVAIGCGEAVVDSIIYEDAADGASRTFDGTRPPDAVSNDDLTAWCDSVSEFGTDGVLGTPGEPNDPCFSEQPTECLDGSTMRPIVPPTPGDVVITEYMPNPDAVGDDEGEWFELYVGAAVDLNGLSITKLGDEEPTDVIGAVECLPAAAGSYLVFAKSTDPAINGGLPTVDQLFTLAMSNTSQDGTGFSVGWGGQFLDTVTWTSSGTGASSSLDPAFLDPTANDEEGAFCEAQTAYGDGDLGTPGAENERCPVDAPEGSCVDENGDVRPIVAPAPGDVWISEFMADPSAVGDTEGEWFELTIAGDFDLNALEFGRDGDVEEAVELETCSPVTSGDRIVLAKNADPSTNGGLENVAYEVGLSLVNSNGALFVATGGELLDAITWTSTESGASRALDPSIIGPEGNDDEANWCDGAAPYGDGDLGTPGAENGACGGTPPGTCDDGGTPREVVFAGEGDLVITEWMANPSAVGDTDGEWFEVLVTADVDLNGLQFGDDPKNPDDELDVTGPCISASAGDRIVLARNADMATNGGLGMVVEGSFSLTNGASSIFVGVAGTAIDTVNYSGSSDGASTSVAPGSETASDNDDEANHCPSGTPYGDGDLGTPGAENVCE